MQTKIFYFSTTGNSLVMARSIAEGLGDTELIPMPKIKDGTIEVTESRVGFVVPVYAWGLNEPVVKFLKRLKLNKEQYIFAVATCGGTPGKTLVQLQKLIKKAGGSLKAGFVVKEGANSVVPDPDIALYMKRINKNMPKSGKERFAEILYTVEGNRLHDPETSSFKINFLGSLFYKMGALMTKQMKMMDTGFSVDDKCNACRICERICPVENVKVVDGRPQWNHECAMCNACIQWCPEQAIHFKNETRRYNNPEIKVRDLILR